MPRYGHVRITLDDKIQAILSLARVYGGRLETQLAHEYGRFTFSSKHQASQFCEALPPFARSRVSGSGTMVVVEKA